MSKYIMTRDDDPNALQHYGVIGMKWGIHRAEKRGQTYNYRSYGQKRYAKKVDRYKAQGIKGKKLSKVQDKLELYKQRDKNREDYARRVSVGKQIAKNLLMTPIGAGNYNRLRAAGYSRLAALGLGGSNNEKKKKRMILLSRSAEFATARSQLRNNRR